MALLVMVVPFSVAQAGLLVELLVAGIGISAAVVARTLAGQVQWQVDERGESLHRGGFPTLPESPPAWADRGAPGSQPRRPQRDPPRGAHEAVWIEGVTQPALNKMVRRVHFASGSENLGVIHVEGLQHETSHPNMYGQPYDKDVKGPY